MNFLNNINLLISDLEKLIQELKGNLMFLKKIKN